MKLVCKNVSYTDLGPVAVVPSQGTPESPPVLVKRTTATVNFRGEDPQGPISELNLTFNDIIDPVEFFPGKIYELTLTEETVEE